MNFRSSYLFFFLIFTSCKKQIAIDSSISHSNNAIISNLNNTLLVTKKTFSITSLQYPLYDPKNNGGISGGVDQATNGTLFYVYQNVEHLIICPNTDTRAIYTSPIHLVKMNNEWIFENGNYGRLMDRTSTAVQLSPGVFVWTNASDEKGISGNVYISKTNSDNTLTWKQLSTSEGMYANISIGNIDGIGEKEILTYKGAELGSPEFFEVYTGSGINFTKSSITLPSINDFKNALGSNEFTFGSFLLADIDTTNNEDELILTSSRKEMNAFYSFIILKFDIASNKFVISKVIKPNGALKEYSLAVAAIKTGNFDDDNNIDIAVTMGQGIDDKSGVQFWYGDGIGGLIPGKSKIFQTSDLVSFTDFEVGKSSEKKYDDVFLHFNAKNTIIAKIGNDLDLTNFLLINDGQRTSKFSNISLVIKSSLFSYDNTTNQFMYPVFMKGYFINNRLRLIGLRGKLDMYGNNNTGYLGYNEFDLFDGKLQ